MNSKAALQNYRNELEVEIYHFAHYKCSILPELARQARLLLSWFRADVVSETQAEEWLWRLEIDRIEAMQ